MVFSVSGLRRGVRRCLDGRHARAGRSPRASEVEAPAKNRPVDRVSTRGTMAGHSTDAHVSRGPGGDRRACPSETAGAGDVRQRPSSWCRAIGRTISTAPAALTRPEGASVSGRHPYGPRTAWRARFAVGE